MTWMGVIVLVAFVATLAFVGWTWWEDAKAAKRLRAGGKGTVTVTTGMNYHDIQVAPGESVRVAVHKDLERFRGGDEQETSGARNEHGAMDSRRLDRGHPPGLAVRGCRLAGRGGGADYCGNAMGFDGRH